MHHEPRAERKPLLWPYIFVAVLFTALRVALAGLTPVLLDMSPSNLVDDTLFAKLGVSIQSGDWLGAYDNNTLAKNPGYSIFLAACGALHVNYQIAMAFLLALAALSFAFALRPVIKKPLGLLLCYLLVLYTPLFFTTAFFRRVYRDGLTVPVSILAFAGMVGLYLRRNEKLRSQLPFTAAAAPAIAALQVIKENGAWIAPFALCCGVVVFGSWCAQCRRQRINIGQLTARSLQLVAIAVCALLISLPIKALNSKNYGVGLANERFNGSFAQVCSELSSISEGKKGSSIWVSNESLGQALANSPTLASIEDELHAEWAEWAQLFDGEEVYGDMCYWALREALLDAGGYQNAVDTASFWQQVHLELQSAFNSGKLTKQSGLKISGTSPAIPASDTLDWLKAVCWTFYKLGSYAQMNAHLITNQSEPAGAPTTQLEKAAQRMLGTNACIGESANDGSALHGAANAADTLLGHLGAYINLALLVMLAPLFVFQLATKRIGLQQSLVIIGLLLSAFAFEAATTWYVSYQLDAFGADSYLLEVYKYSPEFYVCTELAAITCACNLLGARTKSKEAA